MTKQELLSRLCEGHAPTSLVHVVFEDGGDSRELVDVVYVPLADGEVGIELVVR